MPELPEVETVRRTLEGKLTGRRITQVEVAMASMVRGWEGETFTSALTGASLGKVGRRGKYLLLELTGEQTLVIHLGMTGQLVLSPSHLTRPKHTHIIWTLEEGTEELRYTDPRRFGAIHLIPTGQWQAIPGLASLGPEPLDASFNPILLQERLQGKKTKIKGALLDQRVVAGLGNIYADEALFRAGIHPERTAASLSYEEINRLVPAIQAVLREGLEHGGTSISDYVDGEGKKGSNQDYLQAYGRAGAPCLVCGTMMQGVKVGGRSTTFCPRCQR